MSRSELTHNTYGRLRVIELAPRSGKKRKWRCICECGVITCVTTSNLVGGNTKSCGCLRKKSITKHGYCSKSIYHVWENMKGRCYRQTDHNYNNYGAKGIRVCQEWKNDPYQFIQWALANGWCKELQIDRIDVCGNYEPGNCRFVTQRDNNSNKLIHKSRLLPVGVSMEEGRVRAQIKINGKSIHLGMFKTVDDASTAYMSAKNQIEISK